MIKIIILNSLRDDLLKKFKKESFKIYALIKELKQNPNKGKILGRVGSIIIRELKYKSFRFYYLIDGRRLGLFNKEQIQELLIKFVKMSKTNNQQKTIDESRRMLSILGFDNIKE